MSEINSKNIVLNYNCGTNINLLSPKKISKKNLNFPKEIRFSSVKKSNKITSKNNNIIFCPNKDIINSHKLSDISTTHSLAKQIDSSDNKNNMNKLNNSKIKLNKIRNDDINKIQKVLKTPQVNNIKLEFKIDNNNRNMNSHNKKLTAKNKYILNGSFRNINKTNNTSNNNSSKCLLNNRNNSNAKINKATALVNLKINTNDGNKINTEKNNNKIYLIDYGLLAKKNFLSNQSSDFGNIKKNSLKYTFDIEAAKINKIKINNDNSNLNNLVTNKDEYQLIKESITNMSTNNESKIIKRKITIDSKNSLIKTNNNVYKGGRNYCSEEIHFYYVNMIQKGKKFEQKIEGE